MVVDVWVRALTGGVPDDDELALLDAGERRQAERFAAPVLRRRYVGSHALLRRLLARHRGVDPVTIAYDRSCEHCGDPVHGRPRLVGGGPAFSLSHSDRFVLVAIGAGPLGGDVEDGGRRPVSDRVIERSATRTEAERFVGLGDGDRHRAFLELWTAKEAVAKALGLGLVLPFGSFSVAGPGPVVAREGAPALAVTVLPLPGAEGPVAAVAAPPGVPVVLRD